MGILLDGRGHKVWVALFIKVENNFMLTRFASFLYGVLCLPSVSQFGRDNHLSFEFHCCEPRNNLSLPGQVLQSCLGYLSAALALVFTY